MKLDTLLDLDVVALEQRDRVSMLVHLAAPQGRPRAGRVTHTLEVVLDRSGSMAGEALDAAKAAIGALVTRLDPEDRFGLVTFDDEVQVVVPCGPLDDKDAVRAAVAAVHPGGMTNLSGGYLRGIQEARRAASGAPATLVLVSDGHANVGVSDADRLATVARGAHEHGIATSTIGLGAAYDEALLAAVARGGTGNHAYAEDGDSGAAALAAEVDGLLDQVAQAVTLTVRPTGHVAGVELHNDLPAAVVEQTLVVEVGDLLAGEERKLLVSFDVPAMPALGLATVASIEVRWVDVETLATQTVSLPVTVNVVPGDEAAGRVPHPVVRTELVYQQVQRAKRRAAQALRSGDLSAALEDLRDAEDRLGSALGSAPLESVGELAEEADAVADLSRRARADARLASKVAEMDAHRKSRKRGRGA